MTPELATLALVRARSCELIGERTKGLEGPELFLVGLFSLLDVMLSRSMGDVLDNLPLSPSTADALLGRDNRERATLDAVIAYESGEWNQVSDVARLAGVDTTVLPAAYTAALRWAQEVAEEGLPRRLLFDERTSIELIEGELKLRTGVHHDRTVPGDRFFDRFARDQQEPHPFVTGLHSDLVTAVEQHE